MLTVWRGVLILGAVSLAGVRGLSQESARPGLQPQIGIPGVIAAGTTIELVKDGFRFLEGPNGTPDGGLYFSDLGASIMYGLDPSGQIRVVREKTNGANGMALTRDGGILSAEHELKRISRWDTSGAVADFVTTDPKGEPLLRPNDVIFDDKRGGVYFTDPGPFPNNKGRAYVHYVRPDRHMVMISDELRTPNGLALTLDGRVLLVDDTEVAEVYAFDLNGDGSAKDTVPRVFARLRNIDPPRAMSYADGMCVDAEGRVYVASAPGIQVFDKAAKYLGTIEIRRPSSLAFSGPNLRTLYITAGPALYKVQMIAGGPHRPGNK
jgi:gluconolactonase